MPKPRDVEAPPASGLETQDRPGPGPTPGLRLETGVRSFTQGNGIRSAGGAALNTRGEHSCRYISESAAPVGSRGQSGRSQSDRDKAAPRPGRDHAVTSEGRD